MTSTQSMADPCWVCGGGVRPYWADPALVVVECARCRHLHARHTPTSAAPVVDYHQSYDQDSFLDSLGATRRRQADRILEAVERVSPGRALFDFGCGRGWFLDAAVARGYGPVGGGDVSPLAVSMLRDKHIPAVTLAEDALLSGADFSGLGFVPEIISFLDVIEHFEGDLSERFAGWVRTLPAAVRLIVVKVPVREGIMFSAAAVARRLAWPGLARQLFQVGTPPPHFQYFSRDSLDRFVKAIGLDIVQVIDDLDFEAESLAGRAALLRRLPQRPVATAARLLASGASRLGRFDTRIVIASRR